MIKKVNTRKRLATIEVVMFNRKTSVNLGLEILSTSGEDMENSIV